MVRVRHPGAVDKASIRAAHRSARRGIEADAQSLLQTYRDLAGTIGLPEGPGAILAGFVPVRDEPPILALLSDAERRGMRVLVPRTRQGGGLAWLDWSSRAVLGPDRHGLTAPLGEPVHARLADAMAILVPALAVDHAGFRVGQGGGYYDRVLDGLARWPTGPLRIAVVHPAEVLGQPAPREPHDQTVDVILTQLGWIECGQGLAR